MQEADEWWKASDPDKKSQHCPVSLSLMPGESNLTWTSRLTYQVHENGPEEGNLQGRPAHAKPDFN